MKKEADETGEKDGTEERPAAASKWYAPSTKKGILIEVLVLFGGATLICSLLWQLQWLSAFIKDNLQAFIAAVFLYVPTLLLIKRKESFAHYGLTTRPIGRGLLFFLVASVVVFPLFAVGFYIYYSAVCAAASGAAGYPGVLRLFGRRFYRSFCRRFVGHYSKVRWRLPGRFGLTALTQFLVVALPEEYFFRGYLQTRLEAVWPSRRRFLGAQVGRPLLSASLLFALGHVLVDFNVLRLAVFFPALVFGWMRSLSGTIVAGVLFHACSNLVSDLLHKNFFPLGF